MFFSGIWNYFVKSLKVGIVRKLFNGQFSIVKMLIFFQ